MSTTTYVETGLQSGVYQRLLNANEAGMIAAIKQPTIRELIRIHAFANFHSSQPTEKVVLVIREAWKALRLLKSPDIATTFCDEFKQYEVTTKSELEQWLARTFLVATPGRQIENVVKEMQENRDTLPVLYLVPQSGDGEEFKGSLILFISHWRTEAAGAFKIIDQILEYAADLMDGSTTRDALDNHETGSEVQFLTPSLEDVLMPNTVSTSISKSRVQQHFDNFNAHLPQLDFPMQHDLATLPSNTRLARRTYSSSSTDDLVKRCKSHAISVTSAIHSAYLSTLWSIASPESRHKNYACLMPAQVRTRLPKSSPYRTQGAWSSAQMLMLTAAAGQDFLSVARSLKSQYALADQESWLHEDARDTSEQLLKHLGSMHAAPASMPWFTSHGVLDREILHRKHGDVEIDDVLVFADSLGPGAVLGLWTFRDKLNLEIHWNKSFHTDEIVVDVLDGIEKVLQDELGAVLTVERRIMMEF